MCGGLVCWCCWWILVWVLLVVDLVGCFLLEVFGLIVVCGLGLCSFLLVLLEFGFGLCCLAIVGFLVVVIYVHLRIDLWMLVRFRVRCY